MTNNIKNLIHGRETYIADFGDGFVMKRPLPTFSEEARKAWLKKQYKTKETIDAITQIGNPRYNIPKMIYIKDDEYQLLEERAPGEHLTPQLYNNLTQRQQYEIIDGIAAFLVDMNESKTLQTPTIHKISEEFKFARFDKFINNKMKIWFTDYEISNISRLRDEIRDFQYETRLAWSHSDLNSGNVLYDPQTSTLSFIDFAEASYKYIYRDIFAPLQIELDICKPVYETYYKIHNDTSYHMPDFNNKKLQDIMKYRLITVLLKRFVKAADDLRTNPSNEKSVQNNMQKVEFIRQQMHRINLIEQQFCK